ncbi:CsbD family protein [Janibacter alkaliphilus]|uniref:Uncharacterized protein YjbJ (UPF0337 family) n=1 Tax=Janibacter alkaliphilus TaxID=1069963 RepID=A0A852X5K4_9MICO|nr:CsbD family protein [Janibacter alkaliphilus]NYG38662.1 uncharacterized protein YjbJ (UPF0337 family) [Janibacter alkaliphilus]
MGLSDKIENTKDQALGKAKEAVGDARGDDEMKAEGQAQETKGDAKQAVEKGKDALGG